MKIFILVSIFLAPFLVYSPNVFCQSAVEQQFSTEGAITKIDSDAKVIYVKNEGGLELTFHTTDTTQVLVEDQAQPLTALRNEDEIEIDYFYNQDYEKIAKKIRKEPPQASS